MNRVATLAAVVIAAVIQQRPNTTVVIELPHDDVLVDGSLSIVVSGLTPKAVITLRARSGATDNPWTSSATFTADAAGRVDLGRMAPDAGSYKEADPMGLFWSASRVSADEAALSDEESAALRQALAKPVPGGSG